jgi:hypothetical protein
MHFLCLGALSINGYTNLAKLKPGFPGFFVPIGPSLSMNRSWIALNFIKYDCCRYAEEYR